MPKIRLANNVDILKVSRLWLNMVKELAPDLNPNMEWWRRHAEKFMKTDDYFMFVAEEGGRILGFVDYFLFPEPATSKIHAVGQHLYVLPEHRNNEVSGKLWKIVLRHSKKRGAEIHELFCFEKEQKFWERHKFSLRRFLMRKE
jgi:GNAT superfamily N-acetyltransferase